MVSLLIKIYTVYVCGSPSTVILVFKYSTWNNHMII